MNFSIAVISKNRSYTKAFKRVMVDLQPLIDALENVEIKLYDDIDAPEPALPVILNG